MQSFFVVVSTGNTVEPYTGLHVLISNNDERFLSIQSCWIHVSKVKIP
jgi:hypothetical protein